MSGKKDKVNTVEEEKQVCSSEPEMGGYAKADT